MRTGSGNACLPRGQTDLHLTWDHNRRKDCGSSDHQILHYHPIPELVVAVVVKVGAARSQALAAAVVFVVAVDACLVAEREEMADSQQRLLQRRRARLRACRLADRTPVLALHNGFEKVTGNSSVC